MSDLNKIADSYNSCKSIEPTAKKESQNLTETAMKTKLISTFNVRGGVGKSLLTCMLADYVSLLRKRMSKSYPNVLVIDFDPQSSTSIDILGDKAYSNHAKEGRDLSFLAEQLTSHSIS